MLRCSMTPWPTRKTSADPIAIRPTHAGRPGRDAPYENYALGLPYDEMFYAATARFVRTMPRSTAADDASRRRAACAASRPASCRFLHQGITFTVYSDNQATERIIPTDLLPRIVTAQRMGRASSAGLNQRIQALNLFLRDIYSDGRVLKDGVVPRSMIYGSKHYRREMRGLPVPHGAYVNVCGSDLVRNEDGDFVVLEDNLRVPSGVSYMLANRDVVRRAFPGGVPLHGRARHRALSAGAAGDACARWRPSMKTSRSRC